MFEEGNQMVKNLPVNLVSQEGHELKDLPENQASLDVTGDEGGGV